MKKIIVALSLLLSCTASPIYPYLLFPNGESIIDNMSASERAELKEYTIKYQNEYDKNSLSFDNINNIESCFTKKGCDANNVNWNGKYTLSAILRKLDQADKKAADIAASESVKEEATNANHNSTDIIQNRLFFSKTDLSDYMAMGIFMSGLAYIVYKVITVRMAKLDASLTNAEQA